MSDAHDHSEPPPLSPERKRDLLALSDLGRAALDAEPGPEPTPTPRGADLSPRSIEILSLTPDGRGALEAMGITPV